MTTNRQRLTAARLEQLDQDLTARERAVLAVLATMHAATTDQVARCVFTGEVSASRLARRHLQRLTSFGLVRRFADRSRDRQVGAPGHVHALTAAGLRLSNRHHALGLRQRTSWRPTRAFLAHRLAISELYTRLIEQQHRGGPTVGEFRAEPDCWRTYLSPAGEQLVIRPDALVRLVVGDAEVSWFAEVDLDTETRPATIAEKCHNYRRYELSGQEQRRSGVFPTVIFIVPSRERQRMIARVIAQQPPEAQALFVAAIGDEMLAVMAETEVRP